ncbi:MAG: PBP1A family penicillin-binding protein [Candidatus Babeliales bacterium]|nr:PBP1A family penicillin-binding protein [Candidatus Babeliales bacterium]
MLKTKISHLITFTIIFIAFCLGILIALLNNNLVDFSVLENYNPGKPSIILDEEGNEWARFELDKRDPVKYNHIPQHLINAFVASEDREFFNHSGISFKGIIRSIVINISNLRIVQGASTITQQLVKLLFFDSKKTFQRKVKEQFFALLVERQFSKEQILETYLNHVYFGCGIYGIQAAAQRFFSKSVDNITISEAAVLAGIVRSPANYCPLLSPTSAQKRRDLILYLMRELNFITVEEYEQNKQIKLLVSQNKNQNFAPHLKETIRISLEDKFGKQRVYCGGLIIQTTINRKIQENAQREFINQLTRLKRDVNSNIDGALISMDVKTGEIKALIGGSDFSCSKFNRALQAKRQMGSIFKPIVYAAAVENNINFTHTEIDEPMEFITNRTIWKPKNNTGNFEGKMTLARALSYSNNIIAIKTLLKIGSKKVADLAHKFKFTSRIDPYPALALGCLDVTLKEAIAAFNVFANNGLYIEPHYIKWIKNEWGKKIFKSTPVQGQIIDPLVSGQVAKVLSIGIKRYLGRLKNPPLKCEAIGKTGTTNDCRTSWFSGSTPELTTTIYVGCDDNKPMGENIFGVRTAFPIWLNLNQNIPFTQNKFAFDLRLKEITMNWVTGELCNSYDPEAVNIFLN